MTVFLVGGRGRLGNSLAKAFQADGVRVLERCDYQDWGVRNSDSASRFLASEAAPGDCVLVASGLLDPKMPEADLMAVNYDLPRNIIAATADMGVRVVTFGTVMERLLKAGNPYVRAKQELGRFIAEDCRGRDVLHLQIHTLYGEGIPSRFMFLGLMLDALLADQPFRMTSGRQLREYHHVADDAVATRILVAAGRNGVLDLSHGQPVSLRALAETVFAAMGKTDLLTIGAIAEPAEENYQTVFTPDSVLETITFRPTLPAVATYMTELYTKLSQTAGGAQ